MDHLYQRPLLLLFCLVVCFTSCEIESSIDDPSTESISERKRERSKKLGKDTSYSKETIGIPEAGNHLPESLRNLLRLESNENTECSSSELGPVIGRYLFKVLEDPIAEENFDLYSSLSFNLALFDQSKQYFGKDGEATKLVQKRIRELERFWEMPDQLRVNGQHSESLDDRDKLAQMFYRMAMDDYSWETAYEDADMILEINEQSSYLPESPIFSIDGFLTYSNLIVIGDGLVQMISETGIEEEIVWTGILAHEWAHQIQLNHWEIWYEGQNPEQSTEPSHLLELEADYFAAYYMTHKRGATYNWKRVEQFYKLFFQLGDCNLSSEGHHGTPLQRLTASRLGFELANNAKKKGHILSKEEVHEAFLASMSSILQ